MKKIFLIASFCALAQPGWAQLTTNIYGGSIGTGNLSPGQNQIAFQLNGGSSIPTDFIQSITLSMMMNPQSGPFDGSIYASLLMGGNQIQLFNINLTTADPLGYILDLTFSDEGSAPLGNLALSPPSYVFTSTNTALGGALNLAFTAADFASPPELLITYEANLGSSPTAIMVLDFARLTIVSGPEPIPEPGAMALAGLGAIGLLAFRKLRKA